MLFRSVFCFKYLVLYQEDLISICCVLATVENRKFRA